MFIHDLLSRFTMNNFMDRHYFKKLWETLSASAPDIFSQVDLQHGAFKQEAMVKRGQWEKYLSAKELADNEKQADSMLHSALYYNKYLKAEKQSDSIQVEVIRQRGIFRDSSDGLRDKKRRDIFQVSLSDRFSYHSPLSRDAARGSSFGPTITFYKSYETKEVDNAWNLTHGFYRDGSESGCRISANGEVSETETKIEPRTDGRYAMYLSIPRVKHALPYWNDKEVEDFRQSIEKSDSAKLFNFDGKFHISDSKTRMLLTQGYMESLKCQMDGDSHIPMDRFGFYSVFSPQKMEVFLGYAPYKATSHQVARIALHLLTDWLRRSIKRSLAIQQREEECRYFSKELRVIPQKFKFETIYNGKKAQGELFFPHKLENGVWKYANAKKEVEMISQEKINEEVHKTSSDTIKRVMYPAKNSADLESDLRNQMESFRIQMQKKYLEGFLDWLEEKQSGLNFLASQPESIENPFSWISTTEIVEKVMNQGHQLCLHLYQEKSLDSECLGLVYVDSGLSFDEKNSVLGSKFNGMIKKTKGNIFKGWENDTKHSGTDGGAVSGRETTAS